MFLCYVIESVKSIHACHTRLLEMMLSKDPTDIDCTCMKLARIRIVRDDQRQGFMWTLVCKLVSIKLFIYLFSLASKFISYT